MNTQITPRKNWLQLNIDDSSEDQESPKNKELKYQKVYDIPIDDQSFVGRRDAFSSTKVQKGFFVNQQPDQQYFDNYEVKPKNNLPTTQNKKVEKQVQQVNKSIEKINLKKELLKEEQSEGTPINLQRHQQQNKKSEKKQEKNETLNKEQQKDHQRTNKMFHLNLSDSSQSDLPDSQDQKQNEDSDQQANMENLKIGISHKQFVNQMNCLKLDHSKQQIQKVQQNQQSQSDQQSNNEILQNLAVQSKKLQDFNFDKQPQYQVLDQIPIDKRLRAYITRSSSGLNLLWPEFQVKLQSNGLSLLLVKKQPFALSSVYNIYTKLISDETRYFGKVQSNMAKDFYQIFISEDNISNILRAQIDFESFSKLTNQPRYFTTYLLRNQYNPSNLFGFQTFNKRSLKKCFQFNVNRDKILKLESRKPIYSQQLRGFAQQSINKEFHIGRCTNWGGNVNVWKTRQVTFQNINFQSFKLCDWNSHSHGAILDTPYGVIQ